jgi:predicted ribonuclease YlaK
MAKFYDTNSVLTLGEDIYEEKFYISSITLEEIENIKVSNRKDEQTKYEARRAIRLLDKYADKYSVVIYNENIESFITHRGIEINPDNKIVACAKFIQSCTEQNLVFVSDDICCRTIARDIFGLTVEKPKPRQERIYKGYKSIKGTSEEITEFLSNTDFVENEYVIIENTDNNSCSEMRWSDGAFVALKLPPSKFIKGKNALQRCALDMLLNPDITIVSVLGTYGSGKTYMAMQMALYAVLEKGRQSKIVGIREIIGEGKEPGYLPGDLDMKVGSFFNPLIQQLDGGVFQLEMLKQNGVLETEIPHFLKGTTYNHSILICDEAEDFTKSQIKLIGTRLGENSRIFLSGDYKQSLINKTEDNALIRMCNQFKGNKRFACICLDDDVRSATSKMFAELL